MKKKYLKFPIVVLVVLYAIISLFAITVSAEGELYAIPGDSNHSVRLEYCFSESCPDAQSGHNQHTNCTFYFFDAEQTNLSHIEIYCSGSSVVTNHTSNNGGSNWTNTQVNHNWNPITPPDSSSSDPISSSEVPSSSIPESSSSEPISSSDSSDSSSSESTSNSSTSELESSSSEVVSSSESETSSSESESESTIDSSSDASSSESISDSGTDSDTDSGTDDGIDSSSSSSVVSDPVESEPVRSESSSVSSVASESVSSSTVISTENVASDPVVETVVNPTELVTEEITVTEPITTYTVTPSAYGFSNPNTLLSDFIIPQTTAQSNGNIDENELVIIPDEDVPMAEPIVVNVDSWSLFNLIVSIAVILVALYNVLKLLFQFKKKKEFDDEASEYYEISNLKRNIVLRIVKIALGILTPLFFILTENIWSKMVLFNLNSIIYFIIAIAVCIFWFLCGKNKEELVEEG